MTPRDTLAHQLKIQFELPPGRPTPAELELIVSDALQMSSLHSRDLSREEWHAITLQHVHHTGTYVYKGISFQDLNALLAMVRAQTQGGAR